MVGVNGRRDTWTGMAVIMDSLALAPYWVYINTVCYFNVSRK